ncbi:MAG TPA: restriction endonuclease subunit S [Candidatus Agrococcus pullicola]|uniref:Restriction endonuclease subunit S n=1 Tax=Candidatus Agrococcus pullicola TaxID=2838429 RepID=A0A9D1YV24_9MICO|nr:restriction endonuclease subunit S [Candidatus Agrococcus pullicola]
MKAVSLGGACESIKYGLTASADWSGVGPKFIRITDIVGGLYDLNLVPNVGGGEDPYSKYVVLNGDILVARTGASVGASYIHMLGSDPVFASYLVRFRVRPEFDARYVYYVTKTSAWRDFISSNANAKSAQPNISASAMSEFEFHAPVLEQQRATGEVLGALDDKIAANRDASIRAEALAVAVAGKSTQLVRLGEVARQRRSSVSPIKLGMETVLHFSLPSFDDGRATLEPANEIKSAKNEIKNAAVLVSKLNPRIPRLWPVDTAASDVRRLASTEFIVLESSELEVGELWAAILRGNVFGQLQSLVGGTSNSHQRVLPQDILDSVVPDPRQLKQEERRLLLSLCRLKNQLVEESYSLAGTRDELLPLLMNGRITVKDAERAVEGVV